MSVEYFISISPFFLLSVTHATTEYEKSLAFFLGFLIRCLLQRNYFKADIRKQHDLYVNNLVGDVKANPRDFYRYINSQKKDTQGVPPLKKRQGSGLAQSDFEKASEFNGQFTDVFTKSEHSQVPLLDRSAPFMEDIVVTKEGVTKLLKGLNPSKALGPDELHPRVLKELATELGPVFAYLFQQSIDKGEILKEWSLANICPLFKKGDRSLACNYRPVSLTCVPCKLLEHIEARTSNFRKTPHFPQVLMRKSLAEYWDNISASCGKYNEKDLKMKDVRCGEFSVTFPHLAEFCKYSNTAEFRM